MRSCRLDNLARCFAASVLLLLIFAQQKLVPVFGPPPTAAPPSDARNGERPRRNAVPAYILPDAPAPRWSPAWSLASVREAIGAHDGVPRWGAQPPTPPVAPDADFPAATERPALPRPTSDGECVAASPTLVRLHPALRSSIRPTGPPT